MADTVERLRALLGETDVWGEPEEPLEPSLVPEPEVEVAENIYSDSEEEIPLSKSIFNTANTASMKPLEDTITRSFNHLEPGEEIGHDEPFCSIGALSRYPYEHMRVSHRSHVARDYFAKSKLYERCWDMFYMYPPREISRLVIFLVPSCQVEHLLREINDQLDIKLSMPETPCFRTIFPRSTPCPRYLGRSTDNKMAERLKLSVPSATYRLDTELEKYHEPSKQALEIFTDRIKLLLAAEKKKQKECRERKRNSQRLAKQQSWNQSLQRVRRYLGIQEGNQDDHASTGNHLQQQKGQLTGNEVLVEAVTEKPASEQFDPFQPALYTQEDSVIFICVDIEAYERNHSLVTEIGIATLDTADITLTAPGRDGQNWKQAINARHFRIKEYGHLRNKDFVQGCAEHFQFGSSEWVSIGDTPHTMAECFKNPHLEAIRGPMPEVAIEDDVTLELRNQPKRSTAKRNIVLVGHDLGNDIDYLKGLGFDIHNLSNIHGLLDTATMYRALRKESQSRNLASILADLNIPGWYLHNAGNDAVYTLQAMLGIALKDLEGRWDGIESGVAGENGAWYSSQ